MTNSTHGGPRELTTICFRGAFGLENVTRTASTATTADRAVCPTPTLLFDYASFGLFKLSSLFSQCPFEHSDSTAEISLLTLSSPALSFQQRNPCAKLGTLNLPLIPIALVLAPFSLEGVQNLR